MSNFTCAVKDNRGNSSILIGPHASGKSTLIKQLIQKITIDHEETHQIENLILQGTIFSETQSVLKYLLTQVGGFVSGQGGGNEDINEEELSEFVR